ncbi:MAG: hypothetical protein K940chlam3_00961 [Chlamydiae bacterium]|nr:hypothetical protein [Chlamydiota bacterium]
MNRIDDLISQKKLEEIVQEYSLEELVKLLSFRKGLFLSKLLLENQKWNSNLQEFAISLIEKIKQSHPKEWDEDWRHEAYFGYAYGALGWDIEKEFDAFYMAAQKSITPTPEILMHMAILWSYPGIDRKKMDRERAIDILERVARDIPYMEAVGCLVRLYEETKQKDKAGYWKKILLESEKQELYDRHPYLDFFEEYEC